MKHSVVVACVLSIIAVSGVSAQSINDAQIASIVVTANQVDIDAGTLAASRTARAEVKAFAEQMIADHTSVNKAAAALAARLAVTPQDNPTSQNLKSDGEKNLAHLKTLTGTAFDIAYVNREVAYHQQVIDALDSILIPGASNEELKALLVKVRPAFVDHLAHAKHLQSSLQPDVKDRHHARTHTVTIERMRFQPETLTVSPGDTVVWINKDLVPHTATSETSGFDSKTIEVNQSWKHTVRTTGDITYLCAFHPTMRGLLHVR
jgi:putative membrane protein